MPINQTEYPNIDMQGMAVRFLDFFNPVGNCKQTWNRNRVPKITQFPPLLWKQAALQRTQSAPTQSWSMGSYIIK